MKTLCFFDSWFLLFCSLLILTLPFHWILAAAAAAILHELCHILTVLFLGGQIYQIRFQIGGATIDSYIGNPYSEIISILMGPVGSLSLFSLIHIWPELALCGTIQGIFNLIPIFHSDGYHILTKTIDIFIPKKAKILVPAVQAFILSCTAVSLYFLFRYVIS